MKQKWLMFLNNSKASMLNQWKGLKSSIAHAPTNPFLGSRGPL